MRPHHTAAGEHAARRTMLTCSSVVSMVRRAAQPGSGTRMRFSSRRSSACSGEHHGYIIKRACVFTAPNRITSGSRLSACTDA